MKFNLDRLIELGLIRKIPKSKLKAEESIKTAESWLTEAENNFLNETFRSCVLSSYLASSIQQDLSCFSMALERNLILQ